MLTSMLLAIIGQGIMREVPTSVVFISEWYKSVTDPKAKSIKTIQIRKDATGTVPHRFVVLCMCDGRVHRFDRRPERGLDGDPGVVGILANTAVTSGDSYVLDVCMEQLEKSSECEIELYLNGQVDFSVVIAACYAISVDDFASKFTFLRHNCFFFSWTIFMIVSRYYLPYETPQFDHLLCQFQLELGQLAPLFTNQLTTLLIDIVVDTAMVFQDTAFAGASLRKKMNAAGGTGLALSVQPRRLFWRRAFTARLHFGLRDQLTKKIEAALLKALNLALRTTLSVHMARGLLDEHLWLEDAVAEAGFRTEILAVIWESILEAVSGGLGDIELEQLVASLSNPSAKFSVVQPICAVWNAALHGGLTAVKRVVQDVQGVSYVEAFGRVWFAARDAALAAAISAAQITAKNGGAGMDLPLWNVLWASTWTVWDDCWEEARVVTQPQVVQVLEIIVGELVATWKGIVMQNMRECKAKTTEARVSGDPVRSIANAQLQEHVHNIMRKGTVNADALQAVHSSMARIWKQARQHLPAPAAPFHTMAEHN